MKLLHYVEIENFKRFGEKRRIEWDHPAVLIGPNNGGKTSAIQAIALWSMGLKTWRAASDNSRAVTRRGRALNRLNVLQVPVPRTRRYWHDLKVSGKDARITVGVDVREQPVPVTMVFRHHAGDEQVGCLASAADRDAIRLLRRARFRSAPGSAARRSPLGSASSRGAPISLRLRDAPLPASVPRHYTDPRVVAPHSGAEMTLSRMLADSTVGIDAIGTHLDGLSHGQRVAELFALSRSDQGVLYDRAAPAKPLTLDDFVPAAAGTRREVIHHGKNSLPMFRNFQKRFCRTEGGVICGYNEGFTRKFIGPGYFVARPTAGDPAHEARGAIVVDYFLVPEEPVVEGWPRVVPNSRGFQFFVYRHTRDFMRRVSAHATIGSAFKVEKKIGGAFFILVREP